MPAGSSSRAAEHTSTHEQVPLADNGPVAMNVRPYPSGIREFCGCPGTLPAVAPGEIRVMGVTVHPSIAAGASGIFQNALVPDRIADSFDAEGDPEDQIDAPEATSAAISALSQTANPQKRGQETKRIVKSIKIGVAQMCGLAEEGGLLRPLPERVPAQKVGLSDTNTVNVALIQNLHHLLTGRGEPSGNSHNQSFFLCWKTQEVRGCRQFQSLEWVADRH